MRLRLQNLVATAALLGLLALLAGPVAASAKSKHSAASDRTSTASSASVGPVDLNTATPAQLEALPGVGAATAKKIVAGRPYASVGDLSRAGIAAGTIRTISSRVTVSGAPMGRERSDHTLNSANAPKPSAATAKRGASGTNSGGGPVDLNTASQSQLEALPGVGPATAKKIIAGRPYASVNDLSHAGVPARTVESLRSQVVVAGTASGPAAATTGSKTRSGRPLGGSKTGNPTATNTAPMNNNGASAMPANARPAQTTQQMAPPPAGSGMVWVNLPSGVYHHEGSRWYGKTKSGKYMSEAEAIQAGYHVDKTESKISK